MSACQDAEPPFVPIEAGSQIAARLERMIPAESTAILDSDRLEIRAGRELGRELEQRLGALRLAPLLLVEPRVDERDRGVPGEHLEQTQLVLVELVEAELRDDDHADHRRPVEERDGEQRLLDLRRPSNLDAELGLRRIAREERLARLERRAR